MSEMIAPEPGSALAMREQSVSLRVDAERKAQAIAATRAQAKAELEAQKEMI